jgi:hypothetical protein
VRHKSESFTRQDTTAALGANIEDKGVSRAELFAVGDTKSKCYMIEAN